MLSCRAHAALVACLASFATAPAQDATGPEVALKNPSFEEPVVKARVGFREGGTPAGPDENVTIWRQFQVRSRDKNELPKFTMGLTHGFARTGKQSIFVDLKGVASGQTSGYLGSDLIPIKPGVKYRIGIWGRTDKARPLTLDQRRLVMRVEVDFFTPDTEEQAGETAIRTAIIPGSAKRLLFTSDRWNEYAALVRAPREATWMKVAFRWEASADEGSTEGLIYFDDVSVVIPPGGESLVPVDDGELQKRDEAETEEVVESEPSDPAEGSKPPQ